MNGVSGEECRSSRCVLPSFSPRALGGQVVRRLLRDPIIICKIYVIFSETLR